MAYSSAPADPRPVVSVGMLGHGFMGKTHANALKTIPYIFWPGSARVELAAIAGRSEEKLAESAARYGWSRFTTDWRDIVDDPDIQIFDNVGPDAAHVEPTLAAIRAGKHVVCEKPLATTVEDALMLERAAAEAGVRNLTCFNYRFVPAVRLARDLIQDGQLGEIYTASFRYAQEWRTDPAAVLPSWTGALDIIGCHAIDQARYLIGEIADVSAILTAPVTSESRGEPIDTVSAVLGFAGGAAGTLQATLVAPGRKNLLGWEINGSLGSLAWDLENLNVLRRHRRGGPAATDGFDTMLVTEAHHPLAGPWWPSGHILGWEHGHVNMLAHFVDSVVLGTELGPHAATFADGVQSARVSEAIKRSAATGARVSVSSVG
jgi:predicted dehydrogenase